MEATAANAVVGARGLPRVEAAQAGEQGSGRQDAEVGVPGVCASGSPESAKSGISSHKNARQEAAVRGER
jgi:hypothetical protein